MNEVLDYMFCFGLLGLTEFITKQLSIRLIKGLLFRYKLTVFRDLFVAYIRNPSFVIQDSEILT